MKAISTGAPPRNFALRQLWKRRAGELIPREVLFEVTYRCNLMCLHCYVEPYINEPRMTELTTSGIQRVLQQLFEMGIFHITFTGGEPLCRPDIFKIMSHAKEQGLFFGLKTNGTLINASVADRLKELGVTGVHVSLYGATPTTHEHVTKIAGSYARTIRAIKLLRERKIKVGIKSTMMRCNVAELDEMEHMAKQLDTSYSAAPMVFPKVGQPGTATRIRMDDDQLKAFIRKRNWIPEDSYLLTTDPKRHLLCGGGRTRCSISPQGEVFPCSLWRIPLGDLRQQTFEDIWHGEVAGRIREIRVSDMPECANCELVSYCTRCPGLAQMENSGISGPSSESCRLARAIKGVRDDSKQEALCKPRYRVRTD